jgi:predicted membrane chloride channel (bestrophin family)
VKQRRFKIHHSGGPMVIEFRRAAGWPDVFDRWREVRSDEWGSIFELSAATAGKVLEGIEGTRDGALLAALLELLPAIAARAARGRNVEREQVEAWAERARIFAEQVSRVVSSARPAEKAAS